MELRKLLTMCTILATMNEIICCIKQLLRSPKYYLLIIEQASFFSVLGWDLCLAIEFQNVSLKQVKIGTGGADFNGYFSN